MSKPLSKTESGQLNFKVSVKDKKRLQDLADKYAGGNLSKWLRVAGLSFKPKGS